MTNPPGHPVDVDAPTQLGRAVARAEPRRADPEAPSQIAAEPACAERERATARTIVVVRSGDRIAGRYRVIEVVQRHGDQQSGVYVCEDEKDPAKPRVVLRIMGASGEDEHVRGVLERLRGVTCENVVRVLALVEHEGNLVEVDERCEGPLLSELPPLGEDEIRRDVVPQVAAALRAIHERQIMHADLKPGNLIFREPMPAGGRRAIVLIDFDLATVLPGDRSFVLRGANAGTAPFMAPERFTERKEHDGTAFGKRFAPESDYYAFGITLLWLLGHRVNQGADWNAMAHFHDAGRAIEIPEHLDGDLRSLIGWLVLRDFRNRGGDAHVQRFLQGTLEPPPVETASRRYAPPRPYKFRASDGAVVDCDGFAELARVLPCNPELAARELGESERISQWAAETDHEVARAIDEVCEQYRQEPRLMVFAAQLVLDPGLRLELGPTHQIASWRELSEFAGAGPWEGERWLLAEQALRSGRLGAWLARANGGLADLEPGARAELLAEVEQARQRRGSDRCALEQVLYRLDPERPYWFDRGRPVREAATLADFILGPLENWSDSELPTCYRIGVEQISNGRVAAWLRARGRTEMAETVERLVAARHSDVWTTEQVLRILDPLLPKLRVTLDDTKPFGGRSGPWRVRVDGAVSATVRFATVGRGVPCGVLSLGGEAGRLSVNVSTIESRSLEITLELSGADAHRDLRRIYHHELRFELANAEIEGAPDGSIPLRTMVDYPYARAFGQLLGWAVGGAAIFAGLRTILEMNPATRGQWVFERPVVGSLGEIFASIWNGKLRLSGEYGVFFVVVVLGVVAAWAASRQLGRLRR